MFSPFRCEQAGCKSRLDFFDSPPPGARREGARYWCADHNLRGVLLPEEQAPIVPIRPKLDIKTQRAQTNAESTSDSNVDTFAAQLSDALRRPFAARQAGAAHKIDEKTGFFQEETRGFTEPEDGSEGRYHKRVQARPWASHTFWWVVHNNLAHALIGVLPIKPMFDFHDYTSRKMHGVK